MRKLKLLIAACALFGGTLTSWAQSWIGNEPQEGTFLLYNVAADKFINNGDPKEEWGTNAYLQKGFGLDMKFELKDGAYNLNTNVSNGGDDHYLATSTWCDGGSTPWTFTAVEGQDKTYTISNGDSYLVANDALDDVVYGAKTEDSKSYWKLVSLADFKAAMTAKQYAETDPMDVSVFIKGRSFARNDGRNSSWVTTHNGGNWDWIAVAENKYYGNEAYNQTFDVHQEIEDLPNGVYEVQCSGFDTKGTTVIYGNSASNPLQTDNTTTYGTNKQAKWKAIHEDNAFAGQSTGKFLVRDGKITLGLKRESTKGGDWCVYDEFRLYYYGLDLSAYETEIATLRTELEGLQNETMNGTVKSNISTTLSETASITRTEEAMNLAINNLKAVIDEAKASIAVYVTVKSYLDKVSTLDAAGQASFAGNETASTIKTAYENRTLETLSDDQIRALEAAVRTAALSQTTAGADMTLGLVNPSFENGFSSGWTNSGMAIQANNSFEKDGNNYVEKWEPNGTFSVKQKITLLNSGVYTISAKTKARGAKSAKVFAAGIDQPVTIGDETQTTTVQFASDANAEVEFGFEGVGTGAGSSWLCVDDFRLTYVGGLPDVTAEEGKMNNDIATAQTTAINTYNSERTVANYNAAQTAIANAKKSIAAYSAAATAITDAKALKDAHNFASANAITTFADAIAAIENPYTEGTLADDAATAAAMTLGVAVSGWHGNANGAAVKYMNDGFSLTDFDAALYVNTWSTEGSNDGSNFVVPFYEYWIDNKLSLGEKTWTGSLAGLENGLYKVSAWVRVRAKDETAATDATGITINVNGGEAVDATEGTQVGESQFQLATYEAEGLVKDGELKFNVNIAADNNISWLSFKNVNYTKVRDLKPEEAAVVPTAIALKNGEETVTEIALDATTSTATLTPVYTPANASEGFIAWSTSNADVATVTNGVVTAVSTGTATITATSTLNEAVSGSVTVTVSFPETAVVTEEIIIDGSAKSTVTYGANLIKNGSFEYPNAYYGWTYGTGSTTPITSEKFDIITESAADGNQYLQAKVNEGGAAAGSLNTSWEIEAGKTYVFGYKIKANSAATANAYIGTSLNNKIGQENADAKFAAPTYGKDWTEVKYKFTNSDNYKYLVFNARWLGDKKSFDGFYLCEVTSETVVGNVEYATAAIPTANIGTGAFQYVQADIDAIGADKLVQDEATVEQVEAAYNALKALNVNEPADGQLFNVVLTYGGWDYDQKAMTYIANGRKDAGLYNIQYKEAANQNLAQAFTFTKVEGNNYKMSQIDADGNVRYISTGTPWGGNTTQIRTTTNADDAMLVTVIPTKEEGKWNLWNIAGNNYIGSQDAGVYTVNSHIDFNIIETAKPEIAINTTAAGWGTVMLPFATELPEGVKAYTCAAVEGSKLTLTEVEKLEANKPYLIEGAWNATVTGDAQGTALNYTEGIFTGVYSDTKAPADSYVLLNKNNKLGFYKVVAEKEPTVTANHAYLTVASNARDAFFFDEDETTGIDAIKALADGDAEIYNTNGVRIPSLQKGMNIVKMGNGAIRKIMVK